MSQPNKPPVPVPDTCASCKHFDPLVSDPRGYCFRYPPVPLASGLSIRPLLKGGTRACGEYQTRKGK